nr:hypothetical protein [Tanacetum cinerariifolium]
MIFSTKEWRELRDEGKFFTISKFYNKREKGGKEEFVTSLNHLMMIRCLFIREGEAIVNEMTLFIVVSTVYVHVFSHWGSNQWRTLRNIQIEERVMTIVIPIVTPRQIPSMGVGSWLVVLKPMSLPLMQDSPLGSSVAQNASLNLTKSSTLRIISVTVRGARLEKRLANSGHLELLMKVKIRITSKTFCMKLVSKAAEPTLCRAVQRLLEHPAPHGHWSFSLIYSPNKIVDVIIGIRRTIIYLHIYVLHFLEILPKEFPLPVPASSPNTGRIGVINASDFSLCCLMMDVTRSLLEFDLASWCTIRVVIVLSGLIDWSDGFR